MHNYETIQGWSGMIKQVLLSKRMPPWKANPNIGEFSNSFALPDSNARKLISWIDHGLKRGKGTDSLATIIHDTTTWSSGVPDNIITLKREHIPANGILPYRYQEFSLNVEEDVWLRGIDIKPGNAKVLHHIFITNTQGSTTDFVINRKSVPWTDNYIAIGNGVDQFNECPEGTGIFIAKGSILKTQVHYTTTGKTEEDETRLGFYFHKTPPKKAFHSLSASHRHFTIPPYEKEVPITVSDTLNSDITIHNVIPHMHYRGKKINISIVLPSGKKETLVAVPDYNFNWQYIYKLAVPFKAPKGSVLLVEAIFDNSFQNPLNPDPSKELRFGLQSTDEMLIGSINYTID